MNVGSFFSGIGGIEIGFEKAGFKTEWFIENEPYPQEIIRKHYQGAKIYEDVTKVDFRTVPKVDIFTGGFPCQDISNAGKRAGIKGSRSSLWKYYLKAIRILRPRIVFIENVSALLGRGLNVVLGDLASVGYDAEWHCISASSVGAFHKRDRILIISYPCVYGLHTFGKEGRILQSNSKQDFQTVSSERVQSPPEFIENGKLGNVSNTNTERLQRGKETRNIKEIRENGEQLTTRQGRWAIEPNMVRVVNGIPNRVDRIKCLGNAVVPQVAEVFARAIKEYEEK